jgi:hypothetical protein
MKKLLTVIILASLFSCRKPYVEVDKTTLYFDYPKEDTNMCIHQTIRINSNSDWTFEVPSGQTILQGFYEYESPVKLNTLYVKNTHSKSKDVMVFCYPVDNSSQQTSWFKVKNEHMSVHIECIVRRAQ